MNAEITQDRLRVLADMAQKACDAIATLSKIVQRDHPLPRSEEYKLTEDMVWTQINLKAAITDLLDERTEASTETDQGYREERVERHESFGCIQANRVSGGAKLFGSVLDHHQHFIDIKITRASARFATLDERMTTWPESGYAGHIVELRLSAAQWAELVTCMNVGMGIPCTLTRVRGRQMERVPETHENRTDRVLEDFRAEMKKAPREAREAEKKLAAAIEATTLSGKKKEELLALLRPIAPAFEANVPFVLSRFNEAAETTMATVKGELDATLTMVAQTLGLAEMRARAGALPAGDAVRDHLAELPRYSDLTGETKPEGEL